MIIIIAVNVLAFGMNLMSAIHGDVFDVNSFCAGISLAVACALVIRSALA